MTYINKSFLFLTSILLLNFPMNVHADDNKECDQCNFAAGFAVAVCKEFAACKAIMYFVAIMFLFVALLMCICGGPATRRRMWDSLPTIRQMTGSTVGYSVGRSFINRH
jgi:hypothetical protein